MLEEGLVSTSISLSVTAGDYHSGGVPAIWTQADLGAALIPGWLIRGLNIGRLHADLNSLQIQPHQEPF